MRIISWNCQGAFRKKNEKLLSYKPDIAIIQECENSEKLKFGKLTPQPNNFFWYGEKKNKGVCILSYSDYKVELINEFNPKYRFIIPLKISNENSNFILFAVWAMDDKVNKYRRYIGQVWEALNFYSNLLGEQTILIGDFNSNKIWDTIKRIANHSDVVQKLNEENIFSIYHKIHSEQHGEETTPTFYLHRNKMKPYHIDYCFASNDFILERTKFEIGSTDDWLELSDHSPLFVDLNQPLKKINLENSIGALIKNKLSSIENETKKALSPIIENLEKRAIKLEKSGNHSEQERLILIEKITSILDINKMIKALKS